MSEKQRLSTSEIEAELLAMDRRRRNPHGHAGPHLLAVARDLRLDRLLQALALNVGLQLLLHRLQGRLSFGRIGLSCVEAFYQTLHHLGELCLAS